MRDLFPGHYPLAAEEVSNLWEHGLFVLDANVLLNAYRYSATTREQMFDTLKRLGDRLWIPHQAAYEFQKNRLQVIQRQRDAFDEFEKEASGARQRLISRAEEMRRHPVLESATVEQLVSTGFSDLDEYLDSRREIASELLADDKGLLADDTIRDRLTEIVGQRVGPPYDAERLAEIYAEGSERFADERPPGYMDAASKDEPEMYGDLVLWMQILDKSVKTEVAGLVLVTDDTKDDWWWRFRGRKLGPRPELVEELKSISGAQLHMYTSDLFLRQARDYLDQDVSAEAVEEAERVRFWVNAESRSAAFPAYTQDELEHMLKHGFRGVVAVRVIGITYRQLDYWARTKLVEPSVQGSRGSGTARLYSYRDLIELWLIKQLLDSGLSLQRVRSLIVSLRELGLDAVRGGTIAVGPEGARLVEDREHLHRLLDTGEAMHVLSVATAEAELLQRLQALAQPGTSDERD
jgi:DNA-binding transcriptional MerR regulator